MTLYNTIIIYNKKQIFLKKCNVIMILILIIILITQQNSPQNRHFIFTSNKSLAIRKLGRIKEKEILIVTILSLIPLTPF